VPVEAGGGCVGLATGGCFFAHAPASATITIAAHTRLSFIARSSSP